MSDGASFVRCWSCGSGARPSILGKTLEGFDFSFNPSVNRQQIFDLATCRFVERHETVLIQGPAGIGKSHMAQALSHEACRRGFDFAFVSAARMLGHLHGGHADGTYERRLLIHTSPVVLVLEYATRRCRSARR